jgi:haloacetate dehalogenase
LHAKLSDWGSVNMDCIEPTDLADYEHCFSNSPTIHTLCEDYRARASVDLEHDHINRTQQAQSNEKGGGRTGGKIACDRLMLWGGRRKLLEL